MGQTFLAGAFLFAPLFAILFCLLLFPDCFPFSPFPSCSLSHGDYDRGKSSIIDSCTVLLFFHLVARPLSWTPPLFSLRFFTLPSPSLSTQLLCFDFPSQSPNTSLSVSFPYQIPLSLSHRFRCFLRKSSLVPGSPGISDRPLPFLSSNSTGSRLCPLSPADSASTV